NRYCYPCFRSWIKESKRCPLRCEDIGIKIKNGEFQKINDSPPYLLYENGFFYPIYYYKEEEEEIINNQNPIELRSIPNYREFLRENLAEILNLKSGRRLFFRT